MRLALCFALLVACGTPKGPCGPATCNGCCDDNGACVAGNADSACGRSGNACDACPASRFCKDNGCFARCTSVNCGGCCDDLGVCKVGDSPAACGKSGGTCTSCGALGACAQGVCGGTGGGTGGSGGGAGGGAAGGSSGGAAGGAVVQPLRVFATSQNVVPNFGGVLQGDRYCLAVAQDAGLGGTFVAWLSTDDAGARSRFPQGITRPWVLTGDGGSVFVDFAQLAQGPLLPLNRDERGTVVAGTAWTGTSSGGVASGQSCSNWASTNANGTSGNVAGLTDWTQSGAATQCTVGRRLYCFQVQ